MQEGSVIREHRKLGPDVWSYRWWESGPNGNRVHRRIVLGTAEQLRDLSSARQMTSGLTAIDAQEVSSPIQEHNNSLSVFLGRHSSLFLRKDVGSAPMSPTSTSATILPPTGPRR